KNSRRRGSDSALARGRQGTAASSGSAAADSATALSARDRPPHDHEAGVARQVAHLRRPAGPLVEHADVALVELPAKFLNGGVESGVVLRCPLRERRVSGGVHADETRHRLPPLGTSGDYTPSVVTSA